MSDSLDRLTIQGFKSIRTLEEFKLKSLNVLIGGNGAGKSNLIGFFRLMSDMINGQLNRHILARGGVSAFLYNGRKTTDEMSFDMRFGIRGYRFKLVPAASESCFITNEARFYEPSKSDSKSGWWELGPLSPDVALLVAEATGDTQDSQYSQPVYQAIASWQIYHFHDASSTSGMRNVSLIEDDRALKADARNIAPFLLRLRKESPKVYQEILDAVRLAMPFFDDFGLTVRAFGAAEKVALDWRQTASDYPFQAYHLSDGTLRFICLTTALLQPDPPSTIVIDEPELGLHPSAIAILSELIQGASQRTQLIVATQSPALVDHFAIDDIIVVNRSAGASTFKRLDRIDYCHWLESYSVGELWTKDVISGGPVYE